MRLTTNVAGREHHVSVPRHGELRIGLLNAIVTDVAASLGIDRRTVISELFE